MAVEIEWPGPTDRLVVVGQTGSGKTTASMWHLSGKDFISQPWLCINFKGDELMNSVAEIKNPLIKTIGLNELPGEQGLYFVNPLPHEGEQLDDLLRRVWEKGNCGVFVDEVYQIKVKTWFEACMVQGRSKRIPMIICTQRPARMPLFVFSEAQFAQIYNLMKKDDRIRIEGDFPGISREYHLAPYCSYWYNVGSREVVQFGPVPESSTIIETFRAKFPPNEALGVGTEVPVQVRRTPQRRLV